MEKKKEKCVYVIMESEKWFVNYIIMQLQMMFDLG